MTISVMQQPFYIANIVKPTNQLDLLLLINFICKIRNNL